MNEVNKRLEEMLPYGGASEYVAMEYNEEYKDYQHRIGMSSFHIFVLTADDTFVLVTRDEVLKCPLKEVDVDLFWNALSDIAVNEEGEIEQTFLHFDIETPQGNIWHWFEWFFGISVGERYFK